VGGAIALVGSGEFSAAVESIDRELLAATGRRRPRVVILPAMRTGKDDQSFRRWAEMGHQHFTALGAEVEPVYIRSRRDAEDDLNARAVGEADLVYLAGAAADFLCRTLEGSPLARALQETHRRGGVIAGCSAGAVALGQHRLKVRRRLIWPFGVRPALGIVPGVAVFPRYDARPEVLNLLFILRVPRGTVVLGIDRETAVVGDGRNWQVQGSGRVTIWRGRRRTRHHDGDVFRLEPAAPAPRAGLDAEEDALDEAIAEMAERPADTTGYLAGPSQPDADHSSSAPIGSAASSPASPVEEPDRSLTAR
jgi:cyanophycinase